MNRAVDPHKWALERQCLLLLLLSYFPQPYLDDTERSASLHVNMILIPAFTSRTFRLIPSVFSSLSDSMQRFSDHKSTSANSNGVISDHHAAAVS
jgi:hypothetical protein